MKKLAFIFLITLIPFKVFSFQCLYNGREYMNSELDIDISIPISSVINVGETTFFDLSSVVQCKNTQWWDFIDYINFFGDGVNSTLDNEFFKVRAITNNGTYPLPIQNSRNINILTLTDGQYMAVPVRVAYLVDNKPGKIAKISKGSNIANIYIAQTNNRNSDFRRMTWRIFSLNDAILTSGTCNINNGNDIKVDFGGVNKNNLDSSGLSSVIRRSVEVLFNCDLGGSAKLNVTLSGNSSSFSKDSISLSNENLAVQTFSGGKLLSPGGATYVDLTNGIASVKFDFILVKKDGSDVKPGFFNGSAIFVTSID